MGSGWYIHPDIIMALLFMESTNTDLGASDVVSSFNVRGIEWQTGGVNWSTSNPTSNYTDAGAINLTPGESFQIFPDFQWTAVSELVVAFWFRIDGNADLTPTVEEDVLVRFRDVGDSQLTITAASQASGEIQLDIRRGTEQGTIIGTTTTGVLDGSVWQHLEIRYKCDNSSGELEIRRNGVQIFELTGMDTQDNANSDVTNVTFGMLGASNFVNVSEIIVYSLTGDAPNTLLGRHHIQMLKANANSSPADWDATGAGQPWQNLDLYQVSSGTNSINTTTVGHQSRFDMDNLSSEAAGRDIIAVGYFSYGGCPTGTESVEYHMINGTTDTLVDTLAHTSIFESSKKYFSDNPDTGLPWTVSEIDAIQFEVELI